MLLGEWVLLEMLLCWLSRKRKVRMGRCQSEVQVCERGLFLTSGNGGMKPLSKRKKKKKKILTEKDEQSPGKIFKSKK